VVVVYFVLIMPYCIPFSVVGSNILFFLLAVNVSVLCLVITLMSLVRRLVNLLVGCLLLLSSSQKLKFLEVMYCVCFLCKLIFAMAANYLFNCVWQTRYLSRM
jgi:hypothetical protein